MSRNRNKTTELTPSGADHEVEFIYESATAKEVCLAGDFNGWNLNSLPLGKDANGTWRIRVAVAPGHHEYRFIVDGDWQNDPHACGFVPNEFETSRRWSRRGSNNGLPDGKVVNRPPWDCSKRPIPMSGKSLSSAPFCASWPAKPVWISFWMQVVPSMKTATVLMGWRRFVDLTFNCENLSVHKGRSSQFDGWHPAPDFPIPNAKILKWTHWVLCLAWVAGLTRWRHKPVGCDWNSSRESLGIFTSQDLPIPNAAFQALTRTTPIDNDATPDAPYCRSIPIRFHAD